MVQSHNIWVYFRFSLRGSGIFDDPLNVTLVNLLLDHTNMEQEELLKIISISGGGTAPRLSINFVEFLLHKFICKLFFFFDQPAKVLELRLSARYLVSSEVIIDLAGKDIIAQAKLSHLLQKVLDFGI